MREGEGGAGGGGRTGGEREGARGTSPDADRLARFSGDARVRSRRPAGRTHHLGDGARREAAGTRGEDGAAGGAEGGATAERGEARRGDVRGGARERHGKWRRRTETLATHCGRPCWTAHAEKTGRAPRATPRGPFYFPRARFRCSRLRLVRRPDSFGAHFPRGTRRARAPPRPRTGSRSHPRLRASVVMRRGHAARRDDDGDGDASGGGGDSRRSWGLRGIKQAVSNVGARDRANGANDGAASESGASHSSAGSWMRRGTRRGRASAGNPPPSPRPRPDAFAPQEGRIGAESTHHSSSASPLIHLGPAPNAIVSLPPPLSRSQSSASEPTAPDAPRIIPPHRRPRRAPRRALRDSRLIAAATPRP